MWSLNVLTVSSIGKDGNHNFKRGHTKKEKCPVQTQEPWARCQGTLISLHIWQ